MLYFEFMKKPIFTAAAILLIFVSATAILFMAEAILRLVNPDFYKVYNIDEVTYYCCYDKDLGWAHIPGVRNKEYDITINSKGLRGREYPYKPAGKKRVLMLGDSVVFGFGVADDETFSARLERATENTEFINTGVCGWGTDQEWIFLKKEGLKYEPGLVILNFCGDNDFADNYFKFSIYDSYTPKPYFVIDDNGALKLEDKFLRLSAWQRLLYRIDTQSYLYNTVLFTFFKNNKKARLKEKYRQGWDPSDYSANDPQVTLKIIKSMRDELAKRNIKFMVLFFPYMTDDAFEEKEDVKALSLIDFCRKNNIDIFNMKDYYKDYGMSSNNIREYFIDGMHFSKKGQRLAADIIKDILMQGEYFAEN